MPDFERSDFARLDGAHKFDELDHGALELKIVVSSIPLNGFFAAKLYRSDHGRPRVELDFAVDDSNRLDSSEAQIPHRGHQCPFGSAEFDGFNIWSQAPEYQGQLSVVNRKVVSRPGPLAEIIRGFGTAQRLSALIALLAQPLRNES